MIIAPNYILLDAARMDERIETAIKLNEENVTLFNGKREEYLRVVSPFLFKYSKQKGFASWVEKEGWGKAWGVFVFTEEPMVQVQKHFRKLINVRNETGEIMYFRFYDPRVLRIFLPTCDKVQLEEFFGPVEKFIAEDEDPNYALIYSLNPEGLLKTEKVLAGQLFNQLNTRTDSGPASNEISAVEDIKETPPPKRKWYFLDE